MVALKEKGDNYYKQQNYRTAISYYNQILNEYQPKHVAVLNNRAMAYMKLQDYEDSIASCKRVLEIDNKNMKAYYIIGKCKLELHEYYEAEKLLHRCLDLAKESKIDSMIRDAQRCYFRTRKLIHQIERQEQLTLLREAKSIVSSQLSSNPLIQYQLEQLIDEKCAPHNMEHIPDHYICKITMEIMLEPVITPSGISYEREAIETYLRKNATDPVTREACTINDLRPNIALREACYQFLMQHPWSFES